MINNLSAIDIFCGVGGLSFGLKNAGINVLAGIDVDKSCKYAFEKNVDSKFISADVSKISGDSLIEKHWDNNDIHILVGCAPCQPFSTHSNKNKNKKNSTNWQLLNEFKRLVEEINPEIISIENVPNLANQKIFENFISYLKSMKYHVWYSNVFCPDYGIPQKRRRLVLLASKLGDIELLPPTHNPENYITVRDAIGEMPEIEAGEIDEKDPLHRSQNLSKKNKKRIIASKQNGTWEDWDESLLLSCHKKDSGRTYKAVYGRMSWNEPSSTITTQFYNYGTGRFGHPTQNRALSLREGAILQTFPKDYKFCKNTEDISFNKLGKYIGNAVPVRLGYIIGESIKHHIREVNDD